MAGDVQSLAAQGQQTQTQGAQAPGEGAAVGGASPPGQQAADKAARPEWLPENFWDAEKASPKFDEFGKHYSETAAVAKAEQDRLAAFPQKIEDFKLAFPDDLKGPDGKPLQVDETNPEVQDFRKFAFENKVDPKVANSVLGLYAKNKLAETARINARVAEEKTKLGPNVTARIDAVTKGLVAHVSENEAKALTNGLFTADQVSGLERILQKLTSQGAVTTNGAAHEQGTPPPKSLADRMYPNGFGTTQPRGN